MSSWVVDASVAAKWFLAEEHTDAALRLLDSTHLLHAPKFFALEIDHILVKKIRRGELASEKGTEIREALVRFPIVRHSYASLRDLAFGIACATGRAFYDCLYVALAILLGARMVTADRRLYNALSTTPLAGYLCWVEDFG